MFELLGGKIAAFVLSLNIICLTTNGTSIMRHLGNLIKHNKHQLCFVHAIQLVAVHISYNEIKNRNDEDESLVLDDISDPDKSELENEIDDGDLDNDSVQFDEREVDRELLELTHESNINHIIS